MALIPCRAPVPTADPQRPVVAVRLIGGRGLWYVIPLGRFASGVYYPRFQDPGKGTSRMDAIDNARKFWGAIW